MNHKVTSYTDLKIFLDKHNLEPISSLCFLPENLKSIDDSYDFIYSETTTDLKKTFKGENIEISYLTNDKPLLRVRKSADWIGPTILIGLSTISENPNMIGITLNVLSSYLYDFFKGTSNPKKVKFDIVIESKKKKEYQKISYEGNIEGIEKLETVIKSLKQ